jgi:hypothetical protein
MREKFLILIITYKKTAPASATRTVFTFENDGFERVGVNV